MDNNLLKATKLVQVQPAYESSVKVEAIETATFDTIRQGKATNQLTKISNSDNNTDINLNGEARIKDGEITVFIDNYTNLTRGLSPTTYRLLDALTVSFTESGAADTLITIPLKNYMEKCNIKDPKTARKQVNEELNTLYNISLEWKEKNGKHEKDFAKTRLCDSVGIKKGMILFNLTPAFYTYLKNTPVMPYPPQLYRINSKYNPHSFFFLRKIAEHKNMNYSKSNADIIGVKTLLNASPEMPKYRDIAKGGEITRRIIDPFERDMDALEDTITWEYCHKNGQPLSDEETKAFTYELFEKLLIKITWKKYPDREFQKKVIPQAKQRGSREKQENAPVKRGRGRPRKNAE